MALVGKEDLYCNNDNTFSLHASWKYYRLKCRHSTQPAVGVFIQKGANEMIDSHSDESIPILPWILGVASTILVPAHRSAKIRIQKDTVCF